MKSVLNEKEELEPADTLIFCALVLKGSISEIEKIKYCILDGKAKLIFQKISGDYLYISKEKPDRVRPEQ